jgi:RNA polymerase sigma-70 factor, ECF subfamily
VAKPKLFSDKNLISENESIDNFRNGNVREFEVLFENYYSKLCDFVIGFVRSSDVAEDIVQDLFLKVWERRYGWYPNGSIRSYLFKCARNAAIDYLRNQKLKRTYMCEISIDIADNSSPRPDNQLEIKDINNRLQQLVNEMSERQRTIFVLNRIYKLTYREIADIHGISIKTVETHMARALKIIREKLLEKK